MKFGKLENLLRLTVPQLLLIVFLLAGFVALPVPRVGLVRPDLILMTVYYWAIYRPTIVPAALCFVIGLVIDIVNGTPPGMNALLLVTVQWMVSDQRRFLTGQPYIMIWAGFCFVAGAAAFLQWLLYNLAAGQWMDIMPLCVGAAVNILLFPLVTILLIMAHRTLHPE